MALQKPQRPNIADNIPDEWFVPKKKTSPKRNWWSDPAFLTGKMHGVGF